MSLMASGVETLHIQKLQLKKLEFVNNVLVIIYNDIITSTVT